MSTETLDRVRTVIADVCAIPRETIGDDAFLLAFDIDSLRTVDLLLEIETTFAVEAPESDPALRGVRTVRDLARYVDALRAGDRR